MKLLTQQNEIKRKKVGLYWATDIYKIMHLFFQSNTILIIFSSLIWKIKWLTVILFYYFSKQFIFF
jgi:hypothetical protein